MAYIVGLENALTAKADTWQRDQKADVLRLARRGHEQAQRGWIDYRRSDPLGAAEVAAFVDGGQVPAVVTKAAAPDLSQRASLVADLDSPDPGRREAARGALARLAVTGRLA